EQWLLCSTGVLKALAFAVRTLTEPGDGVILQPPVYHPFAPLIRNNRRVVVENPLKESEGEYSFDLDHLDKVAEKAKVLLLCNPHNPVGRVFKREELHGLLEVCARRRLTVISDEIHSDIIMPGNVHVPLYSLAGSYDVPVVVLTAHTKTFNLAGIPMAWIIAPDDDVRQKLQNTLAAAHDGKFSHFAAVAAAAAYGRCASWLDALIAYIDANRAVLKAELETATGIRLAPMEGTYLAWIDFRKTGIDPGRLNETMLRKAALRLNAGEIFGVGGSGFQRMNLATPRSRILEACGRIREVFGGPPSHHGAGSLSVE
ncbi:MAG: aminotransferase class I/II-fold pyridoxal phosphate-dependent enzyme, partial [Spirochaetales bacterium]|nr:aminotransferase class I/II-fold pyridoxal phosphate-dependent enzyme [Spirochaetales bacterium]